jgi:hypothetical protein
LAERAVDLEEVRRFVQSEIESYRYEVPEGALGRPLPDERVERELAEMRAALVKPEWRSVRKMDRDEDELRQCILVAEAEDGYHLYYDPVDEDFVLATIPPTGLPETFGVRGDAVGCFMAR